MTVIQNLIQFLEEEKCKSLLHLQEFETHITRIPADTFQEFDVKIRKKISDLKGAEPSAEVECVTEIFLRYISLRTANFEVK